MLANVQYDIMQNIIHTERDQAKLNIIQITKSHNLNKIEIKNKNT